ncbi:MAG: hypothetical protein LC798_15490 [Chloroflexi bacterium]|nr:hypothetical protein [Chloroflexota bacterium]
MQPQRAHEPARKVRVPVGIRAAALARSQGACVMCLHRANVDADTITPAALRRLIRRGIIRRATQVHHVFPRQRWPELARELANLVGVCGGCHDEHERARRRLPRDVLPPETIALAGDDGRMLAYLERTYPA